MDGELCGCPSGEAAALGYDQQDDPDRTGKNSPLKNGEPAIPRQFRSALSKSRSAKQDIACAGGSVYVIDRQEPIRKLALTSNGQNSQGNAHGHGAFWHLKRKGVVGVVFSPPQKCAIGDSNSLQRTFGIAISINQNAMKMVRQAIPGSFAAILRI